jgi:hypothetical protein
MMSRVGMAVVEAEVSAAAGAAQKSSQLKISKAKCGILVG